MNSDNDQPMPESSWWYYFNQKLASTRIGSWIFSRTVHRLDRILMSLTNGKASIPGLFAGLPVIRLTTIGHKSGKERTVPLAGFRDGEKWFVIASNFGSQDHPAWYKNLKANPEVKITHDGQTRSYLARDATESERKDYWDQASEIYIGYEAYKDRAGDREIPIVVLEPGVEN
jgi:deazaflavin-dependent oxidoreductase (nitroreductase family)